MEGEARGGLTQKRTDKTKTQCLATTNRQVDVLATGRLFEPHQLWSIERLE